MTYSKASVWQFDDQNWLFFSNEDWVIYAVRRTYVTWSAVDNKVAQTNWNIDTMEIILTFNI